MKIFFEFFRVVGACVSKKKKIRHGWDKGGKAGCLSRSGTPCKLRGGGE